MKIDVAFLPREMIDYELSNTVCIVLDIFRATTSIVTAFSNGCKAVIPVLSLEEARQMSSRTGPALFAGERKSIKLQGCDLGNSPFEFSRANVEQKTIIMTTSNGTAAIKAAETAYSTLIGSFINAKAVFQEALHYQKDVLIICAGTEGTFSLEDALCAGLLVQMLAEEQKMNLTDSAVASLLLYQEANTKILDVAGHSRNGKRLLDLNRQDEVDYCLQTNIIGVVPHYTEGKIVLNY